MQDRSVAIHRTLTPLRKLSVVTTLCLVTVEQRASTCLDAFSEFRYEAVVDYWVADVVDVKEVNHPMQLENNHTDISDKRG